MINSTQEVPEAQGADVTKDAIRSKLESDLDAINSCGQVIFGLQKFLIGLERDDLKDMISELDSTLSGLSYTYRILSNSHNDLNKDADESE